MRAVITQPVYLPPAWWLQRALRVDTLVLLTDVQFSRKDRGPTGSFRTGQGDCEIRNGVRLTVPVGSRRSTIAETPVVDDGWRRKHFQTLATIYGSLPYWPAIAGGLELLLDRPWPLLGDLTVETVLWALATVSELDYMPELWTPADVAEVCALWSPLRRIELDVDHDVVGATGSDRILQLASAVGATTYLSGATAASTYLDLDAFRAAGIDVKVDRPGLTTPIVALLASVGLAEARRLLVEG